MADIVFRPKYKVAFWLILALLIVLAVLVLGAGVIILLAAVQRPLSAEESIMMISFFFMFMLITLCSLNLIIRKIVIGSSGMSVATLLGTIRRRPFAPCLYYEHGCFIIGKYVMANSFIKNMGELDSAFKKLGAEGKLKYRREKGVLASKPLGLTLVIFMCACMLGIFFAMTLGMLLAWAYVIVIDAAFLFWFIISFNKLPKANRETLKQLETYFQ